MDMIGPKAKLIDIKDIKYHGDGTLSSRFILATKSERLFAKVFRQGEDSFGRSSRELIKNEIAVQEHISSDPNATDLRALMEYRGFGEICDVTAVLFTYNENWDSSSTLEGKIGVKYNRLTLRNNVPTTEEIIALKKSVHATNYKNYNISAAVDIIIQIASQVDRYHNLKSNKRSGIIHMDITPKNVILVEETVRSLDNKLYSSEKAIVIDFGIAREKDKPIERLFNNAIITNASNEYYASQEGIFNKIYSPLRFDDETGTDDIKNAVPRFDTYNIVNLMSLMLTGRLVEYWERQGEKLVPEKVQDRLYQEIKSRFQPEEGGDADKQNKIAMELSRMITYGQKENNDIRRGYDSCEGLVKDLSDLGLQRKISVYKGISPPKNIPRIFAQYILNVPDEVKNVYQGEWDKLSKQAISYKKSMGMTGHRSFVLLEESIVKAISEQAAKEDAQNLGDTIKELTPWRVAAKIGIGIAAAGATWYLF